MTTPLPPVDEVTAGWWDATRDLRLVVQRCDDCGTVQHPPRPVCLACSRAELSWLDVTGAGVVDAWTEVHRSPGPGLDPPYVVARVRLDEGPLLLTRLTGPPDHRCGEHVHVTWEPLSDGRHLPVFAPTREED